MSSTQIGYVCPLLNCGFGTSLARLNDLNGDGVPDLLVGKNFLGSPLFCMVCV